VRPRRTGSSAMGIASNAIELHMAANPTLRCWAESG
jgi:hypothetical protein